MEYRMVWYVEEDGTSGAKERGKELERIINLSVGLLEARGCRILSIKYQTKPKYSAFIVHTVDESMF